VKLTVAKKHTLNGSQRKLALIVRSQVRPTGTSKGAKRIVVRGLFKKPLCKGIKIYDLTRKKVD
jgi:hypothetical protein